MVDKFTGKQYISPKYIQNIKKFTLIKNLVSSCTNNKTRLVNVSLLKSYIDQVKMKVKIFIQEKSLGVLITKKTED